MYCSKHMAHSGKLVILVNSWHFFHVWVERALKFLWQMERFTFALRLQEGRIFWSYRGSNPGSLISYPRLMSLGYEIIRLLILDAHIQSYSFPRLLLLLIPLRVVTQFHLYQHGTVHSATWSFPSWVIALMAYGSLYVCISSSLQVSDASSTVCATGVIFGLGMLSTVQSRGSYCQVNCFSCEVWRVV